jgi:hypothetical protein
MRRAACPAATASPVLAALHLDPVAALHLVQDLRFGVAGLGAGVVGNLVEMAG